MPITIKYPNNPNIDTAFVEQEGGTKNRALMIAPQDISTLELPNNPNSTKGYITVDGKKQRVVLTADITGGGSSLPDQTGHSGEFLTTDGTDASWAVALTNKATGEYSLSILGSAVTNGSCVVVGVGAKSSANFGTAVGKDASTPAFMGVAIGYNAKVALDKNYAIQIGHGTNSESGTLCIGTNYNNTDVNYKLLDADGTIPTARFTTDPVSDGTYVPTLTISSGVATRSWSAPSGGLPSQTGNSGKFLTTDGTDASWSDKPLQNTATGNEALAVEGTASGTRSVAVKGTANCADTVVVGVYANAYSNTGAEKNVLIGKDTQTLRAANSIAIGRGARVSSSADTLVEHAIQLGSTGSYTYNDDSNTFKVANANGNFEIMSADGTIPAARHATLPAADGTYVLKLVIASGVPTLTWVAE